MLQILFIKNLLLNYARNENIYKKKLILRCFSIDFLTLSIFCTGMSYWMESELNRCKASII